MSEDFDLDMNEFHTEPVVLDMGPSHSAMHGTVRMILTLDGDKVIKCDPEIGYLHRGLEKECEHSTWTRCFSYIEGLNDASALLNSFGFALAVEKMLEIKKMPERCQYIRTLVGEWSRISDHLTRIGAGGAELGAFSVYLLAMEARDLIRDLQEAVTGHRLGFGYARVGGVKNDLPDNIQDLWKTARQRLLEIHAEIAKATIHSKIFQQRTKGIGAISAQSAINYGFSGPSLRAAGVAYDIRKDHPYFAYKSMDFEVPVGTAGDNYDRYSVRMEEIVQSVRIVDQCLEKIPEGPIQSEDARLSPPDQEKGSEEGAEDGQKPIFKGIQVPAGEIYSYTESGNGELGFFIVSDGTEKPWRVKVRAPSFYMMSGVHKLVEGGVVADIVPTLDTINTIGGESDR